MNRPGAIGFDLFNTLITAHPEALREAHRNLIDALHREEIPVEKSAFRDAYVEAALRHMEETRKDGRETHNRFWIADALCALGIPLSPEDPRIARTVDAYFSGFYPHCALIPGTMDLLETLSGSYRLGLLSNFTHAPAAYEILDRLDLPRFFETVLISGELGYRKPHLSVFQALLDQLGEPAERVIYVGDDLEADVQGARDAGITPVLTTCVADQEIPSALTPLSPQDAAVPEGVFRISSWGDLLSLLAHEESG